MASTRHARARDRATSVVVHQRGVGVRDRRSLRFIHALALGLLALGREAHNALLAPRVPARWISGGRALREPRTEPQPRWAGASRTANRTEPTGRADFAKREPKWALFRELPLFREPFRKCQSQLYDAALF